MLKRSLRKSTPCPSSDVAQGGPWNSSGTCRHVTLTIRNCMSVNEGYSCMSAVRAQARRPIIASRRKALVPNDAHASFYFYLACRLAYPNKAPVKRRNAVCESAEHVPRGMSPNLILTPPVPADMGPRQSQIA